MRNLLLAPLLLAACGPAVSPAPAPQPAPYEHPAKRVATMKVYAPDGNEAQCGPPESTCPPQAPNTAFEQQCRLAGFRIQRCGCSAMCTGKVERRHFDASGASKTCEPQQEGCAPPPAGAAFQDACVERGFHLEHCGCAWLCSGDPTR